MRARLPEELSINDVTKASKRKRAKEQRELHAFAAEMCHLTGLLTLCGDQVELLGHLALSTLSFQDPGYRLLARAAGLERIAGLKVDKPEQRAEDLHILLAEEPGPELTAYLANDRFVRVTIDPDARPIVVAGSGMFESYRGIVRDTDRVVRGLIPGGRPRGRPMWQDAPIIESVAEVATPITQPEIDQSPPSADRGVAGPVHLRIHPYEAAATAPNGDLRLHQVAPEMLKDLCAAVVRAEGPVDAELVTARIRQGYGQSRVHAATRTKIAEALRDLVSTDHSPLVLTQGRFYHAAGTSHRPRDRTGCDESVRALKNLPDVEVSAAILEALDGAPLCRRPSGDERELPRAELMHTAARLLGYDLRVLSDRSPVAVLIDTQIAVLVDAGHVTVRGALMVRPAGSSVEPQGTADAAREKRDTDDGPQGPALRHIDVPGGGTVGSGEWVAANDGCAEQVVNGARHSLADEEPQASEAAGWAAPVET